MALITKTLSKTQRTRGLSSSCQSNFLKSIRSSNINLDHILFSESRLSINKKYQPNVSISSKLKKFKILTKPSFRISTKIQLHNLYKTSAANDEQSPASKSCLNINFKILTNLVLKSLNKSLSLGPNVSSQICNKLVSQ